MQINCYTYEGQYILPVNDSKYINKWKPIKVGHYEIKWMCVHVCVLTNHRHKDKTVIRDTQKSYDCHFVSKICNKKYLYINLLKKLYYKNI